MGPDKARQRGHKYPIGTPPTILPSRARAHTHTPTPSPWNLICSPLQGTAKVLVDGTADGIAEHFKQLFERGERIVFELRDILRTLGLDPDEFLPIRLGEGPFIAHMRFIMRDTCKTASASSRRINEDKHVLKYFGLFKQVVHPLPTPIPIHS